jgi:hypothetical protein
MTRTELLVEGNSLACNGEIIINHEGRWQVFGSTKFFRTLEEAVKFCMEKSQ